MTIYTIIGSTKYIKWIAKSFTCEQAATNFLHFCRSCVNLASSYRELFDTSPDTELHKPRIMNRLNGGRIHYSMESNELVTDAFMELTLQQSKPKHQFNKELL